LPVRLPAPGGRPAGCSCRRRLRRTAGRGAGRSGAIVEGGRRRSPPAPHARIRSLHTRVILRKGFDEGRFRLLEEGYMGRVHVLAGALALAFGLAAVGGAAARSQATTIRLAANMTAANETPAPKGDVSGAHG